MCRSRKLFVEAWDLFKHAAFQLAFVRKMVPLECILQGPINGNPRVLNRGSREYEDWVPLAPWPESSNSFFFFFYFFNLLAPELFFKL